MLFALTEKRSHEARQARPAAGCIGMSILGVKLVERSRLRDSKEDRSFGEEAKVSASVQAAGIEGLFSDIYLFLC